jgi:hypothetical protein
MAPKRKREPVCLLWVRFAQRCVWLQFSDGSGCTFCSNTLHMVQQLQCTFHDKLLQPSSSGTTTLWLQGHGFEITGGIACLRTRILDDCDGTIGIERSRDANALMLASWHDWALPERSYFRVHASAIKQLVEKMTTDKVEMFKLATCTAIQGNLLGLIRDQIGEFYTSELGAVQPHMPNS